MLERQQKELFDENSSEPNKNILFAWYNPEIKKPELIWLNKPIKLGGLN